MNGLRIPDRAPPWRNPPDDPEPRDEDAAAEWEDHEAERGDWERDMREDR